MMTELGTRNSESKRSTFRIDQMCCAVEEQLIRNRLESIEGIEELQFNLINRKLEVVHSLPDEQGIISAIGSVGMDAVSLDAATPAPVAPVEEVPFWRRGTTILAAIAGVSALASEIIHFAVGEESPFVLGLALVAIAIAGYKTAAKAWIALKTFTLNINFLMALAVIGAMILGEWPEAAMVIALFAIAELIEERSLERARRAIHDLMHLAPSMALTLRGFEWKLVPAGEIRKGEIVRIKPGERLALDGIVRHGSSSVDQSPITGESVPVEKGKGDIVYAGSINGAGTLDYEATHIASESTINQIASLVEKASGNKAKVERFIDRFARYYTPAILGLAIAVALVPSIATGEWEYWLYKGLVLLIVGCPCALVISTPVTVVSGLAAAARRGILIKGGVYLEMGRNLKGIALDKTGTLTEGNLRVVDVVSFNGMSEEQLLHLAAAVELKSEHPIAGAIVREHEIHHGRKEDAVVDGFVSLTGRGANADVDGERIHVGNHRMVHDMGICSPEIERQLEALEEAGKTAVVVTNDREVLGAIGVADTVRMSSIQAVRELHELGLRTALLSGDNARTARSIASRVGIDDVRADLLPVDKIAAIEELEGKYGPMGMAGDGINDVPALAHATVGFAMGAAGTDIALETADVALMEDNLLKLPEFIRLSRRVARVLWENITIALGLKFAVAILAFLDLLGDATLWLAVFADMGASLIVVFNGLKLLRKVRGT